MDHPTPPTPNASADPRTAVPTSPSAIEQVLTQADELRQNLGDTFRDRIVETLYDQAQAIAGDVVNLKHPPRFRWEERLDRMVTDRIFGLPLMLLLLAIVFYLTIVGSNIPSAFLAGLLMDPGGLQDWFGEYFNLALPAWMCISLYELLHRGAEIANAPWWLSGFLIDGVYLGLAWVVSVMLPPMAIFFPMFTLLEDLGYLPRVAFNMDGIFAACGAHGKQALTMSMGYGCNAAGVIACRVIDSPREKLIAILTNNFVPCNGRFPTLILLGTILAASLGMSAGAAAMVTVGTVLAVVLLGVAFTLIASLLLSRTVLRGQPSAFTLELPPYRPPQFLRILYTSLIDRTLFVLLRAMLTAAPAGGVIWLLANITLGDSSLAAQVADFLGPLGWLMGIDGVILLAYVIAIPANEIVVPTIMMIYFSQGRMTEGPLEQMDSLYRTLVTEHGWTIMTVVCFCLFVLLHNPCATTILTIWKETRDRRWTALAAMGPVLIGILICSVVAGIWRLGLWLTV